VKPSIAGSQIMATVTAEPGKCRSCLSTALREVRRFGETSSIRGVSRAFKSSDNILRVIWSLAVIACGAVLGYQIVLVCIRYFDYSYSTVLKNDHHRSVSHKTASIGNKLYLIENVLCIYPRAVKLGGPLSVSFSVCLSARVYLCVCVEILL